MCSATATPFTWATSSWFGCRGRGTARSGRDDLLTFEIESWARSATRLSNLLYHRLHMAKEIQLHMWISFLEGVVSLSEGRMTGGIEIETSRVEHGFGE